MKIAMAGWFGGVNSDVRAGLLVRKRLELDRLDIHLCRVSFERLAGVRGLELISWGGAR